MYIKRIEKRKKNPYLLLEVLCWQRLPSDFELGGGAKLSGHIIAKPAGNVSCSIISSTILSKWSNVLLFFFELECPVLNKSPLLFDGSNNPSRLSFSLLKK